jgi:CRP/FNR family transcriptional regulator, cyclic AMP receptor protein
MLAMPANISLLTDLPLFASLGAEEQALLAKVVDTRKLNAQELLFKVGDPGHAMYVVSSGEIELSITDHAGQKIVLTECRKGDVFGELAMLDAGARTATARAIEASELVELDRDDLLLLVSKRPESALHMLGAMGAMTRKADMLLRTRVARNAQEEIDDKRTALERLTDWIAEFSGSMTFLALNALWFGVWIFLNVSKLWSFDPFPFGLLTMIVSLQAIFLSIIVLLAQNRQTAKDRVRDDIEYEINVKAELEVAHLHEKVDEIREDVLVRLQKVEALLERIASKSDG